MQARIIFIMGVAGSGKSTIGKRLAEQLSLPFVEGDEFHSPDNIRKMQSGIPLTDADRKTWLLALHTQAMILSEQRGGVIACSALKESYREILARGIADRCKWILLEGEYDLIKVRMSGRAAHFMPPELLLSQFETLEIPSYALRVSAKNPIKSIVAQIMQNLNQSAIGIIGLGVMGKGLALNLAEKGFSLSLYNRHIDGKEENIGRDFIHSESLEDAKGFDDLAQFAQSLSAPRRILLMVEAGDAVDSVLDQLMPFLSTGDVVADCGNSHYRDTQRRQLRMAESGYHYLGIGISGGTEGARNGPSIMPGGSREGYVLLEQILSGMAARDVDGNPCCNYIGPDGAGHFVKMVHNGIEYAEMQLIAEVYGVMRFGHGLDPDKIAEIFESWQQGIHRGYLPGITITILRQKEGNGWLIDQISDVARSKGTGAWTLDAANQLGVPSPLIAAAVYARYLSGKKDERQTALTSYHFDHKSGNLDELGIKVLGDALYLARILNHQLGFDLLRKASVVNHWDLDLPEIARIWTNGCIIRSSLMERMQEILPEIPLLHHQIQEQGKARYVALRECIILGAELGLHLPCHAAALNYINGYAIHQPTGNLIQAQRDFFGAHGYQRVDDTTGKSYHSKCNENENAA